MRHVFYFIIGILVIAIVFGALFGIMYLLGHYVCPLFGWNTVHLYNTDTFGDDIFYGFMTIFIAFSIPFIVFALYGLGRSLIKGDI